ncbi:MAG: TlpA disulfide reductase family protein [Bacteroides sp.]|nr:TlpA disulfide reductase family protein [Bacteroides sp.]
MKTIIFLLLFLVLTSSRAEAQNMMEIDREQLLEITSLDTDTTYVINFWATWCSPCIKEIGYFEELYQASQGKKLKVILLSLDFPDRSETQLLPFLRKRSIKAPVRLMTNLDYNSWIDLVDSTWSGAIPATLIYNKDKRIFLEQELTREELNKYVNQISN